MKYYIIAGEASGDLHGSNLIKGIKKVDPTAQFRFWGGELMLEVAGDGLVRHYKETAVMGIVEVLMNIRKIAKNLIHCKKDIELNQPDVVILIDYPGFNFKIAKFAKSKGFKTFYYISPKVWAWKESRVKLLQKYIDKLFIIFPFEVEYFKKWNIDAIYEGNPLLDSISQQKDKLGSKQEFIQKNNLPDRDFIALLVGSRKMEINYLLPRALEVAKEKQDMHFILAAAPSIDLSYYNKIILEKSNGIFPKNLTILSNQTYATLLHSRAAIISSGTASLEASLIKTPQVVCYGVNRLTYAIGRHFVKIKYISLANLILDQQIFKELIQYDCTPKNISNELDQILNNEVYRNKMLGEYEKVIQILKGDGASQRVAQAMINILNNKE